MACNGIRHRRHWTRAQPCSDGNNVRLSCRRAALLGVPVAASSRIQCYKSLLSTMSTDTGFVRHQALGHDWPGDPLRRRQRDLGVPGELNRLLGRASPIAMIAAGLPMASSMAPAAEVASQFSEQGDACLSPAKYLVVLSDSRSARSRYCLALRPSPLSSPFCSVPGCRSSQCRTQPHSARSSCWHSSEFPQRSISSE